MKGGIRSALQFLCRGAVLVGVATSLATSAALAAQSAAVGPVTSRFQAHLLMLINQYRAGQGLEPLVPSERLTTLASEHSEFMLEQRRISHERFHERFNRSHSRTCVENVGFGYRYPQAQLDGWIRSPGHNRNLLDPKLRQVGIAVQDVYVTFFACS